MSSSAMKISTRLALGFGAATALGMAIAVVATLEMRGLAADLTLVAKDRIPKIDRAAALKDNVNVVARSVRNVVIMQDPKARADEKKRIADVRVDNAKLLDELDKTVTSERGRELLKQITAQRATYLVGVEKTVAAAEGEGGLTAAAALLSGEVRTAQSSLFKSVDEFMDLQIKSSEDLASTASTAANRDAMVLLVLAGLMGLLGGVVGWVITRSLGRALGAEPDEVSAAVQRVADGDLATPVAVRSGDVASVMASVSRMQAALSSTVSSVRNNADGVATASAQIAQGNQDLSGRTEQQASALQQTSATMTELSTAVRSNSDNAQQANQLALGASSAAGKGGEVVARVVDTMKGINDSSRKIADIISTIDGIAFQTNILALNAAVEAARAGEQGRGFAVVASEVRSLAQRSAEAAKEIKTLITGSVEQVEAGSTLVDEAGVAMQEIVSSIKRVTDIVAEISAASMEQSTGVGQVEQAVSQMDQATQQNAALVEESAAAAESLKLQAQQLVDAVAIFKVGAGGVPAAHRPPPAAASVLAKVAAKPAPAAPAVSSAKAPAPSKPKQATAPAAVTADDSWETF